VIKITFCAVKFIHNVLKRHGWFMKITKGYFAFAALLYLAGQTVFSATINFTVDPTQANVPISPYIYGSNSTIPGVKNTYYRSGGNRLSAYNWETNWSNAGSDYYYENDTLMGTNADGPGWTYTSFHTTNKAAGADSLVTLPMAGYVSANGEPAVQVPTADFMAAPGLTDPHANFFPITFVKPGAPGSYADPPNPNDGVVYIDEMVNFLVNHLGSSTNGGIKFYDLDNEPGAWSSTHKEVHNYPVSYVEVSSKAITIARQTTAIDPGAQLLGPVGYGWGDFINLSGAPDNGSYSSYDNGNWVPFLNYYLAQMNTASTAAGHRLLHYLDSHVYSEGTDAAGNRVNNSDVSQDAATTRMQLPREMWDPTFTETNWISCCVPNYGPMTLIPRLQAAISQYYPGTKIAFTEYDYGGGGDISGGIAEADFLGVLTKYPGMMASIWDVGAGDQYLTCAFNFFLNYDGSGSKFGDTSILANSNNVPEATVYAAKDSTHSNRLNVIILNKDYSNPNTASVTLSNLGTGQQISSIRAFRFDSAISVITASTAPTFTANTFTDTLPFRSATLYELTLSTGFATATPTATGTSTWTATSTGTPTPSPTGTLPTNTFTSTKTATPTVTSTPTLTLSPTATVVCANLFNSCDSLTANGNWTGTNATRALNTTPANLTQGTGSIQVNVTTGATWNDQIINLDTFTPTDWTGVAQLQLDLYVPASLLAGTTYNNLYLFASSAAVGENSISASGPSLVAGWNKNLTFNIDFTQGSITPGSALIKLFFIFSSSGTNTGTLYVDNIRLVQACATTPTPTSATTPSSTPTPTLTPSFTATPTNTWTSTATPTFTRTSTSTPTITSTPSSTPTPPLSATPSWTPTATYSFTVTSSPTVTSTTTLTLSFTSTLTRTYTPTPSWTASSTNTPTPANTPTITNTPTVTSTPTSTLSPTPTNTTTYTATPSWTLTSTNSYTPTNTPTKTNTPTATSTPTSTHSPTATSSPTPTFSLTSTGTFTWTLTPTNSFTVTNTPTKTNTPTVTYTPTPTSSPTPTVTSTSTGTSTLTLTPTNSLTVTNTPTATSSPTPTLSSTRSFTQTPTATPTSSFTPSATGTPTHTPTATLPALTATPTRTFTPPLVSTPILFPNPVTGPIVNILPPSFSGELNIRVEVFTLAFRKVLDITFPQVSSGTVVTLNLTGKGGRPLSNGLYYVVVETNGKKATEKLLVIR
jgi:mannan endo-1,4-beta-mannosidase